MSRLLGRTRTWAARIYRRARRHGRSHITKVIKVPSRADLPDILHPQRLYLLGGETPKWAVLDCPCGRGHTIELNLANPARARWEVTTNNAGELSVHPSIDYQAEPQCHYWLRNGRIHWVPNRTRA